MWTTTSTLSPTGQVPMLEGIRRRLDLEAGGKPRVEVISRGTILLRPERELVSVLEPCHRPWHYDRAAGVKPPAVSTPLRIWVGRPS